MSFGEEIRSTDKVKAFEIASDYICGDPTVPEEFFLSALDKAEELPILQGIGDAQRYFLSKAMDEEEYTQDFIDGVHAGMDMAKILIASYALSEVPDTFSLEEHN